VAALAVETYEGGQDGDEASEHEELHLGELGVDLAAELPEVLTQFAHLPAELCEGIIEAFVGPGRSLHAQRSLSPPNLAPVRAMCEHLFDALGPAESRERGDPPPARVPRRSGRSNVRCARSDGRPFLRDPRPLGAESSA